MIFLLTVNAGYEVIPCRVTFSNSKRCIINAIIFNDTEYRQFLDGYFISADGDVYSQFSNKILKPEISYDGHWVITVRKKHYFVHRLVYKCWVSDNIEGLQINHKNDNPSDNHFTNLYAGTQKDNIKDCFANGHRVGNVFKLVVYDSYKDKELTFCPARDFINYSGHSAQNGGLKRMFSRDWFKRRYTLLEYKQIENLEELKGVETIENTFQ